MLARFFEFDPLLTLSAMRNVSFVYPGIVSGTTYPDSSSVQR